MSIITLLGLGFGLGMLHALDADHIAAVSALASTRANRLDSIRFCAKWALGHGFALLVIGGCVYLLGSTIPKQLSQCAETLVGLVLIVIGLAIFRELRHNQAHLHIHRHDHLPPHAHWHRHRKSATAHHNDEHRHRHTAVMIGLLHGVAGSAPLLVLLPLSKMASPWVGMLYLAVFSTAILVTMLLFGGVLGSVYQWLSHLGTRFVKFSQAIAATASIVYGGYLLAVSLPQ